MTSRPLPSQALSVITEVPFGPRPSIVTLLVRMTAQSKYSPGAIVTVSPLLSFGTTCDSALYSRSAPTRYVVPWADAQDITGISRTRPIHSLFSFRHNPLH